MNLRHPWAYLASLIVSAGLLSCGQTDHAANAVLGPAAMAAATLQRPGRDWPAFAEPLDGRASVEIRPHVAGYIDRVEFVEGARVKQGQVLFRIDPRPFRAEAERQLAARKRALAELDVAKANHARAQRLMADDATSREEIERLLSADSIASNDLAAANAALSAAKLNLEFTEVRSPIDGRMSRALISRGALATRDSLLTTVVSDLH